MKKLLSMTVMIIALNAIFAESFSCPGFAANPDGSSSGMLFYYGKTDIRVDYNGEDSPIPADIKEKGASKLLAFDTGIDAGKSGSQAQADTAGTPSVGEDPEESKSGNTNSKRKGINLAISLLLTTLVLAALSVFPIVMVSRVMQKKKS